VRIAIVIDHAKAGKGVDEAGTKRLVFGREARQIDELSVV
jgi:hypothetical protein